MHDAGVNITREQRERAIAAVSEGAYQAFFQPLVRLHDGAVVGAEALVRPTADYLDLGAIELVHAADECGRAEELGLRMMTSACEALSHWRETSVRPVRVAVNLSPTQLRDMHYLEELLEVQKSFGLSADSVLLEVTEDAELSEDPQLRDGMAYLARSGVRIALDDFGTGRSTLSHVHSAPVSVLKVDRHFTAGLGSATTGAESVAVVRAIVELAAQLGIEVVAEGIETVAQARTLLSLGVRVGQGFLFSPAVPDHEFRPLLHKRLWSGLTASGGSNATSETILRLAAAFATCDDTLRPQRRSRRSALLALNRAICRLDGSPTSDHDLSGALALLLDARDGGVFRELETAVSGSLIAEDAQTLIDVLAPGGSTAGDRASLAIQLLGTGRPPLTPAALAEHVAEFGTSVKSPLPQDVSWTIEELTDMVGRLPLPSASGFLARVSRLSAGVDGRLGQFQALTAIARSVGSAGDLEQIVLLLAEEARAAVSASTLIVSRWHGEGHALRVLAATGHVHELGAVSIAPESIPVPHVGEYLERLLAGRTSIFRLRDAALGQGVRRRLSESGAVVAISVPLMSGGALWGEMWATTGGGVPELTSADVEFLVSVSGVVAAAASEAERISSESQLAYTDSLTGLANQRAAENRLASLLTIDPDRAVDRVSVAVLDVIDLKSLNDDVGREAGDALLRAVAEVIRETCDAHPQVFAARIGGDEFCLIARSHESFLTGLVTQIVDVAAGIPQVNARLSVGVASANAGGMSPRDLLRQADSAQYVGKMRGISILSHAALASETAVAHPSAPVRRLPGPSRERSAGELATRLARLSRVTDPRTALISVGDAAAALFDVNRWVLSTIAGSPARYVITDLQVIRPRPSGRLGTAPSEDFYSLVDHPASEAIARGGGMNVAAVGDPSSDPGNLELIHEFGLAWIIEIGVPTPEGDFLLEFFGDHHSAAVDDVRAVVPILASAAGLWRAEMPSRAQSVRQR